MVLQVEIYPPVGSTSPFSLQWYELEVTDVEFELNQKIHEYLISDKNKYVMSCYEHSASTINLSGVLTINSKLPGTTLEEKKLNLIEASSNWWQIDKGKSRIKCMQIKWRDYKQFCMIERLNIDSTAGEEEYPYELVLAIHEGA